ncbi:hypothetical protein B5K05_00345 [Rhizobium phaseoli]|uniref:Uncharacterized protein n=1 Tax=Rhizobium etli (strain CIAT 652) TaxID=491916 RepID=B3PPE2_RHIE6|nr:hypothetical protein RHECIAT_CH0004087 [Rhizobium etli CIAT 652]ARM14129.1 hypothetical protein Bra5_CH03961 [Rhizobium phaseoli Brasil 5]KKZ88516.1 hypothetical protein RPHASCH2410_CH05025 [Rhizobium phaseoli Ch24-10]PCD64317.1 hypothetical protein CO648_29670 [Rhizobium phaseoli]PDS68806.1 hypothetical protein CO651_27165 [Rhizobium phaseoli]
MSHVLSLVLPRAAALAEMLYTPAMPVRKQQLFDRIAGKAKVWLDASRLSDYRTATFQSCLLDCEPGFAGDGNSMAREKQE